GTLGWLEPDEDLIYLQAGLPEPVRRFTLAHEIGHAVLHRSRRLDALTGEPLQHVLSAPPTTDLAGCDGDDLDAPLDSLGAGDELLRPGEAYSARAQRESEANVFTAALLLPPSALRAEYLTLRGVSRATRRNTIRALAERF